MPRRSSSSGRNAGTLLALGFLVMCAAGLLALVALVMPQAIGLVLVGGGFFFVCILHYLTWGWWMSTMQPPPDDDEVPIRPVPGDYAD